jgi:hypothetical protein
MTKIEVFRQLPVSISGFKRIEIGSLQVLDQRPFQTLPFIHLADDYWNVCQACYAGGLQAAFTSNEQVAFTSLVLGNEQGLEHTVFAYRGG